MRAIVIELMDHTTHEEAAEFAAEIEGVFQPHYTPFVADVKVLATGKMRSKPAGGKDPLFPTTRVS